MILAELKKIKRHYLLPLSIGVVVLSCLLALIQLTGVENSVVGYLPLTDGILWNNVTLIFPFLITFFGGFLMNREYAEDTLKSNLIIPVSYRKLIFAKIAVTVFAVTLFVAVSFLCSIVFAVILRYPFNLEDVGMAFWKLFVAGITCLIAVMPIIVLFTLKRNWYPTTSGLTIIKYEPNSSNYQMSAAIFVLAVCVFFSLFIITVAKEESL